MNMAELAGQREFTEPFVTGPFADMAALQALAAEHGLKITRGGRFYHLIGTGQDKGTAVRTAREIFARYLGRPPVAIGIGDSENDLPMLAQVDIPVLIPRPDGTSLDLRLPRMVIAGDPGCRGWNDALRKYSMNSRQKLIEIFNEALKAVLPEQLIRNSLRVADDHLQAGGRQAI